MHPHSFVVDLEPVVRAELIQRARQVDYGTANDLAGNLLSVVLSSR